MFYNNKKYNWVDWRPNSEKRIIRSIPNLCAQNEEKKYSFHIRVGFFYINVVLYILK